MKLRFYNYICGAIIIFIFLKLYLLFTGAKSAQKVLHYMLSNQAAVVKSWRARIYLFSSGTLLKLASRHLQLWVYEERTQLRTACLQKLKDVDGLYKVLGNAIFQFVKLKTQPFPSAMWSKRHYMSYDVWKRAMVCLQMVRVVLDMPASKRWDKYNVRDYKWNIRMFRFYCKHDKEITESSSMFMSLPNDFASPLRRKRKRNIAGLPSPSTTSDTPCTVFNVDDSSSADDEDNDDHEEESPAPDAAPDV